MPEPRETRPTTAHFREALTDINYEINRFKKKAGRKRINFFNKDDLNVVYHKSNGRCVYCGIPLRVRGRGRRGSYFQFYLPLEQNGKVNPNNLALVCWKHKADYSYGKKSRESIPDFDSFADAIESLMKSILDEKEATDVEEIRFNQHRIKQLKFEIDRQLSDIAKCGVYKSIKPPKVGDFQLFRENENTPAVEIEKIGKALSEDKPSDEPKGKLKNGIHQITYTGDFKVIRDFSDE